MTSVIQCQCRRLPAVACIRGWKSFPILTPLHFGTFLSPHGWHFAYDFDERNLLGRSVNRQSLYIRRSDKGQFMHAALISYIWTAGESLLLKGRSTHMHVNNCKSQISIESAMNEILTLLLYRVKKFDFLKRFCRKSQWDMPSIKRRTKTCYCCWRFFWHSIHPRLSCPIPWLYNLCLGVFCSSRKKSEIKIYRFWTWQKRCRYWGQFL